jgi:hypothetical protein
MANLYMATDYHSLTPTLVDPEARVQYAAQCASAGTFVLLTRSAKILFAPLIRWLFSPPRPPSYAKDEKKEKEEFGGSCSHEHRP